jgi:hypothetical protein
MVYPAIIVDRSEAPIGDGRRRCKHVGSTLDEFLAADGTSAEVEAAVEDARSGRSIARRNLRITEAMFFPALSDGALRAHLRCVGVARLASCTSYRTPCRG